MAKTIFRITGPSGASFEVVDNGSGGVDMQFGGSQQSNVASLTDSSTGTAGNTVVDVGAAFDQATLNNNFASLTAKVNAILTILQNTGLMA